VARNSSNQKILTGLAKPTGTSSADRCGGVVEKQKKMHLAANSPSISAEMRKRKTKITNLAKSSVLKRRSANAARVWGTKATCAKETQILERART